MTRAIGHFYGKKTAKNSPSASPNAQTKPGQSGEQCAHGRRAYSRVLQRRALVIVIERLQLFMIEVKTTPEFDDWMRGLQDGLTRRRMAARLRKASFGLLGDIAKAQTLAQQLE